MAKVARIKADSVSAPKNQADAEALLDQIGKRQGQVLVIETKMNDKLRAIKDEHEKQAQPLNAEIKEAFAAFQVWAEANRDNLLSGKSKTAKLSTGEISWRITPPSVRLTKQGVVIETLKRLGLDRFLRTKEEVNKEAVLGDPNAVEGIAGIRITQKEEFVAKPFASNIERAEPVKAEVRAA